MRDRRRFAAGMAELAVMFPGRDITENVMAAYWDAMGDLTDDQWEQARLACLRSFQPTKVVPFPTPAQLRALAVPYRDGTAEAVAAFEWLCQGGGATYDATKGTTWSWRAVVEAKGPVVGEAFQAAGGSKAFEREQGGDQLQWLRKRFVEAYLKALEADGQGRLDAPPPLLRLPRALTHMVRQLGSGPVDGNA